MHRNFIRLIAAASIAITSLGVAAAPARADSDDTARALAALLGLAIVGAAIHDKNKRDDRIVTRHRHVEPHKPHKKKRHHHSNNIDRQYEGVGANQKKRLRHMSLPGRCLRSWQTDHGRVRAFGQRCLERHYNHVNALPDRCYRRVWTHDGRRQGYAARCLNRHGYQLAHN